MADESVEQAWNALGLPGDPPRDPKDAALYVPVTFGSVRPAGRCSDCGEARVTTTVYGVSAATTFAVGQMFVCGCTPASLTEGNDRG